jgi:2-polyprenyl-6-methoxyphenol hydroxylase-like FAD-dependent oxidoreductase
VKILIIGAGIGGLTLASLLRQANPAIQMSLVERSAEPVSAQLQPGGTLALKEPGGLTALRRLGMYEDLCQVSKPVADFRFLTADGKPLLTLRKPSPASASGTTWRVPRSALHHHLLRDVMGPIRYGTVCTGYRSQTEKPVVQFADGDEESADLVVACDGVKSAVRRQMIRDEPHYLGLAAITGAIPVAAPHPLLRDGPVMIIGDGGTLLVDQEQQSIGWALTLHARYHEFERLTHLDLQKRVLLATRGWYSPVREIVEDTHPEDIIALGGFYDRNPLLRAHDGNIVLLGDAAHPMSPFRGEGANMAMLDAVVLVDSLGPFCKDDQLERAIVHYEQEMLARTRRAVLLSRRAAREMHSHNLITRFIRDTKLRLADHVMAHR